MVPVMMWGGKGSGSYHSFISLDQSDLSGVHSGILILFFFLMDVSYVSADWVYLVPSGWPKLNPVC